jgi:hypothetical protein
VTTKITEGRLQNIDKKGIELTVCLGEHVILGKRRKYGVDMLIPILMSGGTGIETRTDKHQIDTLCI